MANNIDYGVKLTLDSSQAVRDVDTLLQKLKTLQDSAKLRVTTDVSELSTQIQKCISLSSELAKTMSSVDTAFRNSGDQVSKFGETVRNASKNASSSLEKDSKRTTSNIKANSSDMTKSIISDMSQVVKFANNAGQSIASSLVSAFKKASSAMTGFMSDAFSQYQDLQLAEIAFDKLYDGNASELITKVKRKSEQMPLLGAGELGNAMKSVSPVANRNPDLALRAVEGILKGTLYSGNDIKQYPNMFQNIQQLASGSSTAQDVKELLRAIPTLPTLLKELGLDSELTDNGVLSSKKIQNYVKKNGSQSLLEIFAKIGEETSASDAYDRIRNTWKGITEEIAETITNRWNDALDKSGFYDTITNMLKTLDSSGRLESFMDKLADYVGKFAKWIDANQNTIFDFLDAIVDGLWNFVDTIGNVAKELLTNIGILDKDGNLDKDRLNQLLGYLSSFLTNFVKTITSGIEQMVGVADILGQDGIGALGSVLGFMGSPAGGLVSGVVGSTTLKTMLGTLLGNRLSGISGSRSAGSVTTSEYMGDMFIDGELRGSQVYATSAGKSKSGFSLGKGVAGLAVGLATKGLISFGSQLVESTNMFGNQSKDFAKSLDVAGNGVSVLVGTLVATGNPLIAAAAGVTTALGGFISEFNKGSEAIKENARKNADGYLYSSVSEKKKSIISDVFEELGRFGVNIDSNSDIGKFVSASLSDYLDKTPASKWDSTEAVKTAIRAKEYKEKAWQLAALDETDAYKSAQNSQLIDLNGDSDYVRNMYGKMSRMIEDFHLLGDNYDYNTKDRDMVRSFLGGNSLTVGQYDLYMKTYEKAISEARSTSDSIVKSIENDLTAFFTDEDGTVQTFKEVFDESKQTFIEGLETYFKDPANALTDALKNVIGSAEYKKILDARGGNTDTNAGKGFWESVGDWFARGAIFSPIYDAIHHKAQGGEIKDTILDSHGIDTVPAMLAPGEFVMKQSSVAKFGREAMEALNHGDPTALTRHVTSNLNNNWDYSRSSKTTNNNQQAIRNYYINNQLAKRTRMPYYSLRNMMSGA